MKDMLPAPHEDRVFIKDGTPPLKRIQVVVPYVSPDDQRQRLAEIQARRRRESMQGRRSYRQTTRKLEPMTTAPTVTLQQIMSAVCVTLGLQLSDVLSTRRKMEAFAREMIVYLARRHSSLSFPQLAAELGRSHSSIFDAWHRVSSRLDLRVGQFYTGDTVTRIETMSYGEVVGEIEGKLRGVT